MGDNYLPSFEGQWKSSRTEAPYWMWLEKELHKVKAQLLAERCKNDGPGGMNPDSRCAMCDVDSNVIMCDWGGKKEYFCTVTHFVDYLCKRWKPSLVDQLKRNGVIG